MIRALVDFALNNRFVVIALAILALGWGAISFHNLPVEAYPDIADNYVTVITQWPGRAAEEVEQQVTIPIEIQMNGIPHLSHLRSESIFGLSYVWTTLLSYILLGEPSNIRKNCGVAIVVLGVAVLGRGGDK